MKKVCLRGSKRSRLMVWKWSWCCSLGVWYQLYQIYERTCTYICKLFRRVKLSCLRLHKFAQNLFVHIFFHLIFRLLCHMLCYSSRIKWLTRGAARRNTYLSCIDIVAILFANTFSISFHIIQRLIVNESIVQRFYISRCFIAGYNSPWKSGF